MYVSHAQSYMECSETRVQGTMGTSVSHFNGGSGCHYKERGDNAAVGPPRINSSTDSRTQLSAVGFRVQFDVYGIREHMFTGSSIRVMPLPMT